MMDVSRTKIYLHRSISRISGHRINSTIRLSRMNIQFHRIEDEAQRSQKRGGGALVAEMKVQFQEVNLRSV